MKKEAVIPIGPLTTITIPLNENTHIPENAQTREVKEVES